MKATEPSVVPLSVVMPAYDEEEGIRTAVAAIQEHVLDLVPGSEAVVVDDGSRDQTGTILDQIAAVDPRMRAVHTPNGGHGAALMRGIAQARGEYVFLIDSDNQIPLEGFRNVWTLVCRGEGAPLDGAFGIRLVRHDSRVRRVLTRFISVCLRLMFGVRLRDANVPYKVVRRSVWLEAQRYIPDGTLAPSLFLAVYMMRCHAAVVFVDVAHRERLTGMVSIRRWRLLKVCVRGFRQLLQFRRALRGI